jgi:hypothetical protein
MRAILLQVGFTARSRLREFAVSSYLTISPLPSFPGGMFLWHFPSSRPDRTLSCTLPNEARTFLDEPFRRDDPANFAIGGGGKETRTPDPLHAMQVLYQLSYAPATDRRPFASYLAGALNTRKSNTSEGISRTAPHAAATRNATIIASLDAALVNV